MKRFPKAAWFLAAAALVAVALVSASAASAGREVATVGNLFLADNGGLSPSRLPRHGSAPVNARVEAEVGTLDGSHPPALRSVDFLASRSVSIDAHGLPTCSPGDLRARPTKAAEAACGEALVGRGSAEVEVAFPEQTPFRSTGPVLLFNGGVDGATTRVLLHAYVDVPAPTAIVTLVEVTRVHRGAYGLEVSARIPRIAGGAGSVTKFELNIGRRFTVGGRRHSFLSAGCPAGHYGTKGEAEFADGTKLSLLHVFSCTPTG